MDLTSAHVVTAPSYAPATQFWWVVPLVGAIGALVAIASIIATRKMARLRATLDLIERTESSSHYVELYASFAKLREHKDDNDFLERIASPTNDGDRAIRRGILNWLNHYELIAIGCRNRMLDEAFYADWMRTQIIRDWYLAREFIIRAREHPVRPSPNSFIEFERLVKKYEADTKHVINLKSAEFWFGRSSRKT